MIHGITASTPPSAGIPPPVVYSPVNSTNLQYWFKADEGAYSDDAGTTLAQDGNGVANWGNYGTLEAALQPTGARRPVFKTGGLEGRPYLLCDRVNMQYFNNLAGALQPSGITSINPYTFAMVVEDLDIVGGECPLMSAAGATDKARIRIYDNGAGVPRLNWWKNEVIADDPAMLNPCSIMGSPASTTTFRRNIQGVNGSQSQSTNASPRNGNASTEFLRMTVLGTYFTGRLYEFMYWNTAIGYTSGFDNVRAYFVSKYAI